MDRYFQKCFVIIVCFFSTTAADHNRELFVQGNKAYEVGDISHAIEYYKKMDKKGPAVWANMGNCYFAQKEYLPAIVAWRKAIAACPQEMHGLTSFMQKALQEIDVENKTPQTTVAVTVANRLPLLLLQCLCLLFWYLFLYLICVRRSWRYAVPLAVVAAIATVIVGFLLVVKKRCIAPRAIVIQVTELKAGPHEQFDSLQQIALLDEVAIQEMREQWYKIKAGDQEGWVAARTLEQL